MCGLFARLVGWFLVEKAFLVEGSRPKGGCHFDYLGGLRDLGYLRRLGWEF